MCVCVCVCVCTLHSWKHTLDACMFVNINQKLRSRSKAIHVHVAAEASLRLCVLLALIHVTHMTTFLSHVLRCQYAVDCIDSCGVSPLMDSVRNDHLEMTRYLADVCQVHR